jgi:hypothetical protein
MISLRSLVRLFLLAAVLVTFGRAAEAAGNWATFRAKATRDGSTIEAWLTLDLMVPRQTAQYGYSFAGAIKSLHFTTVTGGAVAQRYSMPATATGNVIVNQYVDGWNGDVHTFYNVIFRVSEYPTLPSAAITLEFLYMDVEPFNGGLPSTTLEGWQSAAIRPGFDLYSGNVNMVEVSDERTGLLSEISTLDAEVAALTEQIKNLNSQVTTLTGQVTTWRDRVTTVTTQLTAANGELAAGAAEIKRLQDSFATALKTTPFTISGDSLSAQLKSVVDGLNGLSGGARKQLYDYWLTH